MSANQKGSPTTRPRHTVHLVYRVLFLYLEPLALLIGAYMTLFTPAKYLSTVHATPTASSPLAALLDPSADPTIKVLLAQLTNVYILFGLLEATLLRSTDDSNVWRAWIRAALLADFGHLLIVTKLGLDIGWRVWELGIADWGKPSCMIVFRVAFLVGLGVRGNEIRTAKKAG